MPNINKLPKKKKLLSAKTTKKKTKISSAGYYNCLLTQAQNNWFDPTTGKKKKITACCQDCKVNAPVLNRQREQEINKLITSYRQVGECLSKLLKPLK